MNPFEENFTAWVDGKLSGEELAAFEKELSAHPEAEKDKADTLQIGSLLRRHSTAPSLTNLDFFNHQLMQRIAAETPREPLPKEKLPFFWPLRRLVLAGGLSLAVALALFATLIPKTPDEDQKTHYFAKILSMHAEDPRVTASAVPGSDHDVTVVWLDGLDYLPGNEAH
jgi:anti-sigma factor RsiW